MSVTSAFTSAPVVITKKFFPSVTIGCLNIDSIRSFHQTLPNSRKMVSKLDESQRKSLLDPILNNGWSMDKSGRDAIKKKFVFTDFNEAFGFMTRVAIKGMVINKCFELPKHIIIREFRQNSVES